ncbi:MAG: protein jag [Lachnospiraceae bacterium]|nr:protein jag [Lachnospiraceae bacterium]
MAVKEYSGKNEEEAKAVAAADLGIAAEELVYEVIEEEKGGFLGLFKNCKIAVTLPEEQSDLSASVAEAIAEVAQSTITPASGETPAEVAVDFIKKVLTELGFTADISATVEEEEGNIYINVEGDDMGTLIGKRGQTLDALQYLTSLVVNRACNQYYKIKLDTENYRARRKETLENLAKNIAGKVKKTRRSVALEPMNPYERRIIHAALQNDKYVETHSEGEEPYRKVIVSMKKGVTYDGGRGYGRGGYNRGGYGNNNRGGYNRGGYGNKGGYGGNRRPPKPRYNDNSSDYSQDYMKDYAAYKEARAAEKAKNEGEKQ